VFDSLINTEYETPMDNPHLDPALHGGKRRRFEHG
jgi:hypothetical protein